MTKCRCSASLDILPRIDVSESADGAFASREGNLPPLDMRVSLAFSLELRAASCGLLIDASLAMISVVELMEITPAFFQG
jgi:hypothetical protein